MKEPLHFSGITASQQDANTSAPPATLTGVAALLQEFYHYVGHIWLEDHDPPQERQELAGFRISDLVSSYKIYRAEGGDIRLHEGLGLERTYLLTQLVARTPLVCLLNSEQPDTSTPRMSRLRPMPPAELLDALQQRCKVRLNTGKDIAGQTSRWGNLCPSHIMLVHDGETGHCVVLTGFEQGSNRPIIWDPWPLRSLLCSENNIAGVAAEPVRSDEPFWTVSAEEFARVIYAAFIPA
jgi:hypothetical protein